MSRSPTATPTRFDRLGGDRRRVPAARPRHPRPDRRLRGPRVRRPRVGAPAVPWLCAGAAQAAPAVPRPVLACGAELKNTFCLAKGQPRVRVAPHRRPGERRDAAIVHRGHRALPAALRHRAAAGRARPASGLPVHQVRGPPGLRRRASRRRARRRAAPSRAHRLLPGRQRRGRACHRRRLRRHRVRHRRHDLGRRVPDRGPRRIPARRVPGAGAAARRRRRHQAAVADGRVLPGCGVPGRTTAGTPQPLAVQARNERQWDGSPHGHGPPRHQLAADLQRRDGCSTRSPRCSVYATRSTTRARPRSNSSSSPTSRERGSYAASISPAATGRCGWLAPT